MEQSFFYLNIYSALISAIHHGYLQSFILTPQGDLACINCEEKIFELDEVEINLVPCAPGATLYLITSKDKKIKGTLIEYWDV